MAQIKNITLRADFAMKVRELAELRCQNNPQIFKLLFNAPDDVILKRVRAGLDVYDHVGLDLGRVCMRMDNETFNRIKKVADSQGYSVPQLVTMTLAASENTLLDYTDAGINANIEKYNQRIGSQLNN